VPRDPDADTSESQGLPDLKTAYVSRRPQYPDWLRAPEPNQIFERNEAGPWRIEGAMEDVQPPLDVDRIGADALAFYLPFHFYREKWGIYIRESGVAYLAEVLKGRQLQSGDEGYLAIAEDVLYDHELFHAFVEIACSRAEIIAGTALYCVYYATAEAAEHEEAMANARSIRWRDSPVNKQLGRWMERQGPGYRDFAKWMDERLFARGTNRAARFMLDRLSFPKLPASGPSHGFLFQGVDRFKVPVRLIADRRSEAFLLGPFPKAYGLQVFVHSNDHPPQHVHIQCPPGEKDTRYRWPDLVPLDGDKPLSRDGRKSLDKYIAKHGDQIAERIRAVYTALATR
jgi:hypothetical protein